MRWALRLGRIAGTEVRIHLTFFLLLAWLAAANYQAGGAAEALHWTVFMCLVFFCVLLHEFGHALAARRYGIRTPDITLYPFGGVARIERMPEKPGEEIVIALAGPIVNVVIAAALWLALTLFGTHGEGGVIDLRRHARPAGDGGERDSGALQSHPGISNGRRARAARGARDADRASPRHAGRRAGRPGDRVRPRLCRPVRECRGAAAKSHAHHRGDFRLHGGRGRGGRVADAIPQPWPVGFGRDGHCIQVAAAQCESRRGCGCAAAHFAARVPRGRSGWHAARDFHPHRAGDGAAGVRPGGAGAGRDARGFSDRAIRGRRSTRRSR